MAYLYALILLLLPADYYHGYAAALVASVCKPVATASAPTKPVAPVAPSTIEQLQKDVEQLKADVKKIKDSMNRRRFDIEPVKETVKETKAEKPDKPVICIFTASYCSPCKDLKKYIANHPQIEDKNEIRWCSVELHPEYIKAYSITSLPTCLKYVGGVGVARGNQEIIYKEVE
jgi:hypothetical protein